jgi:hypothetical protein
MARPGRRLKRPAGPTDAQEMLVNVAAMLDRALSGSHFFLVLLV